MPSLRTSPQLDIITESEKPGCSVAALDTHGTEEKRPVVFVATGEATHDSL